MAITIAVVSRKKMGRQQQKQRQLLSIYIRNKRRQKGFVYEIPCCRWQRESSFVEWEREQTPEEHVLHDRELGQNLCLIHLHHTGVDLQSHQTAITPLSAI